MSQEIKKPEKKDQQEIAKKFCLLQPCEILKDEATGGCYACKIGSSIKNAFVYKPKIDEGKLEEVLILELRKFPVRIDKGRAWMESTPVFIIKDLAHTLTQKQKEWLKTGEAG